MLYLRFVLLSFLPSTYAAQNLRHAPEVGNFESSRFTLTVFSDCFAVLSDNKTVGQPVKFVELYNIVADGQHENLEACVSAEAVGKSNVLRITAPHAYGS